MRWASALSRNPSTAEAAVEVALRVRRELSSERVDLAVLFVSEEHAAEGEQVGAAIREALGPRALVGCSARSVIGAGREAEEGPGLSLTAAVLPGVDLRTFALHPGQVRALAESPALWRSLIGGPAAAHAPSAFHAPAEDPRGVILLADPFSFDAEACLGGVDDVLPGVPIVGGLASAGARPGENRLYRDDQTHRAGAVGVTFGGDLRIDPLVAQGCRPIGQPLFVTSVEGNRLLRLDGRPPIELLRELYASVPVEDRELLRGSLFLGLEMKAAQETYGQGDFLVRNVLGLVPESGELVVAARLHEGQVVQFHLRDARTSAEDLARRLAAYRTGLAGSPGPGGALLFSCLGRGQGLYGAPDHDTAAIQACLGPLALGGFFCNGEIGPVQGRTFLHGYTSSLALFRPREREDVPAG